MEVKDGEVFGLLLEIKDIVVETKTKVDGMEKRITENCADIETLKSKPARRWDTVISTFIAAVVAAVIAIFTKDR